MLDRKKKSPNKSTLKTKIINKTCGNRYGQIYNSDTSSAPTFQLGKDLVSQVGHGMWFTLSPDASFKNWDSKDIIIRIEMFCCKEGYPSPWFCIYWVISDLTKCTPKPFSSP